jgi:voltage-gated potassium channel
LAYAPGRLRFVVSPAGIVDLLAILPFYLSLGIDLRSVRVLRLFRLIRILKLARYNAAIARFKTAFHLIQDELVLFMAMAGVLLYLAAVGIYLFENDAQPDKFPSIFESLWWAVVTLTTVGYGDAYPITVGGRIFTFFVLVIGLGIVALPTGLISSALSQVRSNDLNKSET